MSTNGGGQGSLPPLPAASSRVLDSKPIGRRQRAKLEALLARLAKTGEAGPAAYDEESGAFRVALTEAGRAILADDPVVRSVEPAHDPPRSGGR